MGNFSFTQTEIEGVYIVEPKVFGDARGYFMETYCETDFKQGGIMADFVQDNQSKSRRGVLRGLHFQKTHSQAKLVRVISGEVFDVAVDLRPGKMCIRDRYRVSRWFGNTPVSTDYGDVKTASSCL